MEPVIIADQGPGTDVAAGLDVATRRHVKPGRPGKPGRPRSEQAEQAIIDATLDLFA